jgi:hypothetical protein
MNLDEAARKTQIRRDYLLEAVRHGRLEATRGGAHGGRPMKNTWDISFEALAAFVESLPECSSSGCCRRTPNKSGICSAHGRSSQTSAQFKSIPKSAEHRAKIAAALRGVPKSPQHRARVSLAKQGQGLGRPLTHKHRARIAAGVRRFFVSPAGDAERERRAVTASRPRPDVTNRNLEAFRVGAPTARAFFKSWLRGSNAGRTKQIWLGRWEGRRYGKLGGRPEATLTAAQRAEVERLRAQGWGRRAIAGRLLVSERAVRNVLGS